MWEEAVSPPTRRRENICPYRVLSGGGLLDAHSSISINSIIGSATAGVAPPYGTTPATYVRSFVHYSSSAQNKEEEKKRECGVRRHKKQENIYCYCANLLHYSRSVLHKTLPRSIFQKISAKIQGAIVLL